MSFFPIIGAGDDQGASIEELRVQINTRSSVSTTTSATLSARAHTRTLSSIQTAPTVTHSRVVQINSRSIVRPQAAIQVEMSVRITNRSSVRSLARILREGGVRITSRTRIEPDIRKLSPFLDIALGSLVIGTPEQSIALASVDIQAFDEDNTVDVVAILTSQGIKERLE